jgi:hypothetical protein
MKTVLAATLETKMVTMRKVGQHVTHADCAITSCVLCSWLHPASKGWPPQPLRREFKL